MRSLPTPFVHLGCVLGTALGDLATHRTDHVCVDGCGHRHDDVYVDAAQCGRNGLAVRQRVRPELRSTPQEIGELFVILDGAPSGHGR